MGGEYRGAVRSRDPETSWDAAGLQDESKADLVKGVIVTLLKTYGPLTDEELVDHFEAYTFMHAGVPRVTPQNIRTRRKALQTAGQVRDTGRRAPTRAGATATVWAIA